jgi:uncharacterized repeat protein (TIGR01451 family)
VDNPPLHALAPGVDGPNGVYAYGYSPQFPTTNGNGANYWADVVFLATGAGGPDLTLTNSHTGNFMHGQTGVTYTLTVTNSGTAATAGAVTVTDTLPAGLTATSIAGTGWSCTQPAGPCTRSDALAANATYPSITLTVNVASNAPASVTNTASVSGGGETNTANNQATSLTTIIAASALGTSIWPASAVPGTPYYNASLTVGTKFRSDLAGTVTAIRFYKGAANIGTHIGFLYTATGTLLAQATFTAESASGWQQVNFAAPVSIAANTTYIAAYFSLYGFAYDPGYLNNAVYSPPLHALAAGADGPNGVYAYGYSPQFPTTDGNGAN